MKQLVLATMVALAATSASAGWFEKLVEPIGTNSTVNEVLDGLGQGLNDYQTQVDEAQRGHDHS